MNRKETTKFLGDLLVRERFGGMGKYWASEVSIDYGTMYVRRIDFLQFEPPGQVHVSEIEKGIFTCYEVKSCKEDFYSGFGRNFIGEKNYFVMPMGLYKQVVQEIPHNVGVLVPVPRYVDVHDEFQSPTELGGGTDWKLPIIKAAHQQDRKRPMVELLFCMVRSGHGVSG